ncbi:dihydrodipicolinate synthase family protein [Lacrimispora indolis]|uniref:dihydrodipicolinate synthase family protein n=1 Tax=Lacrimispora indolis TaxID=69825 RepID=UPI00045EC2D2|nr:dihydrodipicolinate synthase family protein [Lacrimispora indolis]
MKLVTLEGISAPVLTPFYENGKVNTTEYTRLIEYIAGSGIKGIFVGGTSGEFVNLRIEERKNLLLAAKEGVRKETTLLFNVTSMNEQELFSLIEWAKKKGADAVSVTAPYYHKYDEKALCQYFEKVANIAEGLPVYLYNMSGMTNNPITAKMLKEVSERCTNICGIKDSSMDFMTLLNYQAVIEREDFEVITGNDAQVLSALFAGAAGGIIAIASVYPELTLEIWNGYRNGDLEGARRAQKTVLQIRELFRSIMPTITHKEALKLKGFDMGPARFPFRDLGEEEKLCLEKGLEKLGVFEKN